MHHFQIEAVDQAIDIVEPVGRCTVVPSQLRGHSPDFDLPFVYFRRALEHLRGIVDGGVDRMVDAMPLLAEPATQTLRLGLGGGTRQGRLFGCGGALAQGSPPDTTVTEIPEITQVGSAISSITPTKRKGAPWSGIA